MGGCTGGNFSGPVCATSQLERLASFFYKSLGSIAPSSVYLWYCMFSGSKAASSPAQQPPGIQSMLAPCQCPESGKTDTSPFNSLLKSQNSRHMFLSSSHLPRKKPQVMLLLRIGLNCTGCSKLPPNSSFSAVSRYSNYADSISVPNEFIQKPVPQAALQKARILDTHSTLLFPL